MKPLKLTIEGLHSFKEKQTVDFSRVCDTGLFGIFGDTGSGKSTILDAITLALYGAVFRAPSRTLGILNSQKDKLEVSFSFAIGIEADRQNYRAERVFKRNKEKRDSVNAGTCRLIEVHDEGEQVIAEGSGEVTKKIEEIIGLNMEDFTRSVVLPQGEFAKFLQLKDAERVRMLERIFGLYKYGVLLNEKAKKEREKLETELALLQRSIHEQGNITAQAIAETQQELDRKEAEKNELFSQAEIIDQEYDIANQIRQLQDELIQVRLEETRHLSTQPEIDLQKSMLQKAEAAEAVKPYFENCQKAESSLVAAQKGLATVLEVYLQAEERNNKSKELFLIVDEELRLRQPELIAKQTRLQAALMIEDELNRKEADQQTLFQEKSRVNLLGDGVQRQLIKYETAKTGLENKRHKLEADIRVMTVFAETKAKILKGVEYEKDFQRLAKEAVKLKTELDYENQNKSSLAAALKEQESGKNLLLQALQESQAKEEQLQLSKPGDLQSYEIKSKILHEFEINLRSLSTLMEGLYHDKADLMQLEGKLKDVEALHRKYTLEMDDCLKKTAGLEMSKSKLQEEIRRLAEINVAAGLAANLAAGNPCPVCGSVCHPVLAKHLDLNEIESRKTELDELDETIGHERQNFDRLNRELVKYQTFIQQLQEQSQMVQARIDEKLAGLADLKKNLLPELHEKTLAELKSYLQVEQKNMAEFRESIIAWNHNCEKIRNEVNRFKDEEAGFEKKINDLNGQLVGLQMAAAKLTASLQELKPSLAESERQYTALKMETAVHDFQAEFNRIQNDERKIEAYRTEIEKTTQELATLEQSIEEARRQKENYSLRLTEIEAGLNGLAGEISERRGKIKEVAGGRRPQELISETENALAVLDKRLRNAREQTETSGALLQKCLHQKAEAQKQVELIEAEVSKARPILDQKMREKGFISLNEYQDALRTGEERDRLRKTINGYEDLIKKYQTQIETLLRKLDGQSITSGQWAEVQNAKKEIAAKKEWITEWLGQMNATMADMANRWQKVKDYQEQQQNLARKKTMVDELCKLLQGDAFVAYMAEEQMRYILKDASGRLAVLTNGRYALKMDNNKDFIISDNTNGGLARPVTSLSGGETFLVSLSLALALSAKIQLNSKNPLEFFFLDEGFGTLDSQLLELVMDSLEKLKHGNLVIGVISHVPELKNRISRRIIVTPAGVNGDGSRVKIEKA